MTKVRKAVIPAAGLGTRFLPITKGVCKEMLPVVDKPTLQYNIEELVKSGITDILIITSRNKKNIEDYFDSTVELDENLKSSEKMEFLQISKYLENIANIYFTRQHQPSGLADAILYAKAFVGNEPFVILLGDDIVYTDKNQLPCIHQLINCYNETNNCVLATMEVPDEEISKYGNVGFERVEGRKKYVNDIIEKPNNDDKLSNEAIIGRYLVTADIFDIIEKLKLEESNKEVGFTDALKILSKKKGLIAYDFEGIRYDTGDKLGFLQANVEFALRDEKLGKQFKEYIKDLSKTL